MTALNGAKYVKLVWNYYIIVKIATNYMKTVDVFLNIWK